MRTLTARACCHIDDLGKEAHARPHCLADQYVERVELKQYLCMHCANWSQRAVQVQVAVQVVSTHAPTVCC